MSKRSKIEEEVYIQQLVEESERKYDNLKNGVDISSMLLLVGSVFAGAFIATPLSIALGLAGFFLFGGGNIASKFIIEKKKTDATRQIIASSKENKQKDNENSAEKILERDKVTSEQLDMMHQFEIDEAERRDMTSLEYESSYERERREMMRYDRGFFGRHDIEK